MKRLFIRIAIFFLAINLVLAIVFFSAGGLQMLSRATIPDYELPASLSSDLYFFRDLVLANEADVTPIQVTRFIDIIDAASPPKSIDDLTLITSQALAVFDNAHTTLLAPKISRLPVRFHWTTDALIIVKAQPEYAYLLGQRVLSLGDTPPEAMLERMSELVGGGTESWRKYRSEYFYSAPVALGFLGAVIEGKSVAIRTQSPEGEEFEDILSAQAEPMPGDPFWDFLDAFPDDEHFNTKGWVSLLHKEQSLPLYLQQTDKLHLLSNLPEHMAVYVRMNASFADKLETLEEFEQRILDEINQSQPKNIIVDFRHNRGGDYTSVLSLVKALANSVPTDGQLYLIVGPNTFSAGIIASSQFKRYTPEQLTVVGSEMGDKLRFRAEGFYPTLPKSEIQLYLTKGWTDLVDGCGWFDDCWPPNKILLRKIGSLEIDIPVGNTWEAFHSGKDLILDAVLDDIAQKHTVR